LPEVFPANNCLKFFQQSCQIREYCDIFCLSTSFQLVSLRIEEGNISALYRDATKRIEILERQSQERMPVMPEVKVQERMAVMPEIKVQKAVAINGRTSSEEIDDVTNASTPSTTRRNSDAEDRFGDDNTYDDDDEVRVEIMVTNTFSCPLYLERKRAQNQDGHK
ncbi:hypothetical protein COOONC_17567, partial [Cooperia oncophora]